MTLWLRRPRAPVALGRGTLPGCTTLPIVRGMFFVELFVNIVVALAAPMVLPVVSALPVLRHRRRRKAEKRDRTGCGEYHFTHVILLHGTIPR